MYVCMYVYIYIATQGHFLPKGDLPENSHRGYSMPSRPDTTLWSVVRYSVNKRYTYNCINKKDQRVAEKLYHIIILETFLIAKCV
jgi:hypothetical protein